MDQGAEPAYSWDDLRREVLDFVRSCRVDECSYRHSHAATQPTLYSACYAVLTMSLFGWTDREDAGFRRRCAGTIDSFQDADGLFRDPVIFGQGWYADDPLWCGRAHLTCHVIMALTALGSVASRTFALVERFSRLGTLEPWLESRDFGARVAWTGNEIMNVGTLLQYTRDFHNNTRAGRAVAFLLDWLDEHHLNPETGVWGALDVADPLARSHAVQAAYHWWPLYFYDRRPIPHIDRALDTVLATQNPRGSFGWGVHNSAAPYDGSACEDIDSIDPLARMSRLTDYRRDEVLAALRTAIPAVLENRTPDGGFQFMLRRAFEYGHPQLASGATQGGMFPTWFRTLSLALIDRALAGDTPAQCPWRFVDCPGYQFWREVGA